MRYLSVCSGIEAATVAWHPLGWTPFAFSEIDKFPSAVLAHHYPDVPNLGDMTKFKDWPDAAIDLLVGGTPCQSFSVAGLRKGLADPRGNLMLTYLAIADRYRPRWLVWENVPGVLSSGGGRDFGAFLGALGELGYGWAYRSLDAQYFGLAQRRERVFVVGCLGSRHGAAAVLFERASLRGDPAPRREAGKGAARGFECGPGGGRFTDLAPTLDARRKDGPIRNQLGVGAIARCISTGEGTRQDYETTTLVADTLRGHPRPGSNSLGAMVAHSLRADGFDASEDGTGRGTPLVPVQPMTLAIRGRGDSHDLEYRQDGVANAILTPNGGRAGIGVGAVAFDTTQVTSKLNYSNPRPGDPCHPLAAGAHAPAVAFNWQGGGKQTTLGANTLGANTLGANTTQAVATPMQVRRLTPRECERLQGFHDDYTLIPYGRPSKAKLDADFLKYQLRGNPKHLTREDIDRLAADGPRDKSLGNSMAVPCMRWIGERIAAVDSILECTEVAA